METPLVTSDQKNSGSKELHSGHRTRISGRRKTEVAEKNSLSGPDSSRFSLLCRDRAAVNGEKQGQGTKTG